MNSKRCAYCNESRELSADHIWASCFLDRMGRRAAHISHQSGTAHGADYVVGDVCERCNNERLSALDDYFCRFYDDAIAPLPSNASNWDFAIEPEQLARTLLKIAYNSSRCVGRPSGTLRALAPHIASATVPSRPYAVFIELLPERTSQSDGVSLTAGLYRCAETRFPGVSEAALVSRIVQVGRIRFHILVAATEDSETFEAAVLTAFNKGPAATRLLPSDKTVRLQVSASEPLAGIGDLIERHHDSYDRFFSRPGRHK